jgi:hypothetical protein
MVYNRNTGFVVFLHPPELYVARKHIVWETGTVSVFRSGEGDT